MENRPSRKAQSDDYFTCSAALKSDRLKDFKFAWLEVVEGTKPDAIAYVIHASNNAAAVPPFAVEHYEDRKLQGYEPSKQVLCERARMSEDVRARIVQAQMAISTVSQSEPKQTRLATPG